MSPGERDLPGGLQPRSAEDARRYPARSEQCRAVRGMLRDHADGDLPSLLQERVEDHVHGCRDCGLALSRAELEVLRLREAYAQADSRRLTPSEEFTATVMARARAELRRSERERREDSRPTEGFTSKVMRSVKRQVERETRRTEEDRRGRQRRKVLLAAAVLPLLAALVVYAPGGRATHVRVVAAADAWLVTASGEDPLPEGRELPDGAKVRTGGEGLLELALPAPRERGAGSRLHLEADTNLSLGSDGILHLEQGRLALASGGGLDLHLADGTKVVVSNGRSRVEALYYHPFDQDLMQVPDLQVRLVVEAGSAQVWRGGEGTEVLEGRVAYFTSRTPVRQDQAVTEDLLLASARARDLARRLASAARQPPAVEETWLGRLVHPVTRQPVTAVVSLRSHLGTTTVSADPQGRFRAPDMPELLDQFVVVMARTEDPSLGTLSHGPKVLALAGVAAGEAPAELLLVPDRRLSGRLLDQDNRPVPGARLLPALVDEALGLVEPLAHLAVEPGADGRFVVSGLPAMLPPQVSLVLVALGGDGAPRICFSSQGHDAMGDAALHLSLGRSGPLRLAGLPHGGDLEVLQEVVGLPRSRLFGRRRVTASPLGEVELTDGAGARLWLLHQDKAPQALLPGPDGSLRPAPDLAAPAALAAVRAGNGPWFFRGGGQAQRFLQVAEVPVQGSAGHVSVHQDGTSLPARAGAMVFLAEEGGSETVFLGICSGEPLAFAVPAGGYSLAAIDEESLGYLRVLPGTDPNLTIPVHRTRSLTLPEELLDRGRRGGGILHLRCKVEGRRMYLTRQLPPTGGEVRDLPPGDCEIRFPDGGTVRRQVR